MHVGVGGARRAELGLVEVGLQAGLKDVERRGEGRCRHAADAVEREQDQLGLPTRGARVPGLGVRRGRKGLAHAPATRWCHDFAKGEANGAFACGS